MGISDIIGLGRIGESQSLNPLIMGCSTSARYIPIYAHPSINTYCNFIGVSAEMFTFNKMTYYRATEKLSYDGILSNLSNRNRGACIRYKFEIDGVKHFICVHRGYICDEHENILMMLTYRASHTEALIGEVDVKYLRLFVSKNFLVNPIYRNIYKRVYTEYILRCIEEDIEVLYLKEEEIEARLYSNHFKVEFNSITELNNHLSTEVANVLAYIEPVPDFEDELVQEVEFESTEVDLPF